MGNDLDSLNDLSRDELEVMLLAVSSEADALRRACEEALEWLQHHGGDALPADEPGLAGLIANLESAINKAQ